VLLAGAGLFLRSLYNVEHVNTGYDVHRLVTTAVQLVIPKDTDRFDNTTLEGMRVSLPELVARLRRIPGVENVGITTAPPMGGMFMPGIFVPGFDSLPKIGSHAPGYAYVSPDYLTTAGIRVQSGRGITEDDRSGNEPVALVNATMARALWPTESAIGKCVRLEQQDSACRTVVGVMSDQNDWGLIEEHAMHVFAPLAQARRAFRFTTWLVIRAAPDRVPRVTAQIPLELASVVAAGRTPRAEAIAVARIPYYLRPWRLSATIFVIAGVLALLVASIGVYSVISYTFAQRTHDIGVRIALGARGTRVAGLVVGEGVRIVIAGVCIGTSIALALGKVVASALYGTTPRDPVILIGAALTLTIVAVAACMVPAWRAMRVDPIEALRSE
jgi:predicted permease